VAKDVAASVRDALSQAATSVTEAMAAPDAMPYMPVLRQLHQNLIAVIQHGQLVPQQGQQPGQGPGAGGPGGQPMAPGPAAGQPQVNGGLPSAPGQGLFPNSPIPSANELSALVANRTGP
jgi:hypothetical protein